MTAAVTAVMSDQTTSLAWAQGLIASVISLCQKHEALNTTQTAFQANLAKLEREIEALAAVWHPLWMAETATIHTAHIMRLSSFGKLTSPEIERFYKTHLDKLPDISDPKIEVQSECTKRISKTANDARTFSNAFFAEEPPPAEFMGLRWSPIYCRQEFPWLVLASQRSLNQARHAYRQFLPEGGKKRRSRPTGRPALSSTTPRSFRTSASMANLALINSSA